MSAESEGRGCGATLRARLPLHTGAPPVNDDPHREDRGIAALTGLHVLVVDDEPGARELIAVMLEQEGAYVTVAASGEEARNALATDQVMDVLMADIAMPVEDGYQLIGKVRADARRRALPALALTACAGDHDQALALDAGYNDHLPKPVTPDALIRVVAELAGRPRVTQDAG